MTTGWVGCSVAGSPSVPISSTTSNPSVTSPTTAYSGGRPTSAPVTTKNWLPAVPGRFGPGLGHGHYATRVGGVGGGDVDGLVPGPATTGLGRVATLDHEAGHDAMEDGVVVEAVLGEGDE